MAKVAGYLSSMVASVIPVGHFIGTIVAPSLDMSQLDMPRPDASQTAASQIPWAYGVRAGIEILDLNESEFAVWAMAHGSGKETLKTSSRAAIESLADRLDVPDSAASMDRLLRDGLMYRLLPVSTEIRRFAERHQLMPLGFGLGNSSNRPAEFNIGQPGFPRVTVNAAIFDIWSFSANGASLWQACEKASEWDEDFSPQQLAALVMQAIPVLLSMDAAYIDVA